MKELCEKQQLKTIEKSEDESADFERAISLTGYGRFHILLTLVTGIASMASGFQNGLSAYILPAAQCDLQLSTSEMGFLNSVFLIGGTTSAMLWGALADVIGRKKVLVWCLSTDAVFTLLSGLSQNFATLCIFRFISGFAIGGPSTILVTFLGEFHDQKRRGAAICCLGVFWTISWLVLPATAWPIISLDFTIEVYGWVFNSWRLFVSLMSIPSFLSAYLLSKYAETPRFLLHQGEDKKALQIMRKIFVSNTRKHAHEYPVVALINDDAKSLESKNNSIQKSLNQMWVQLCCLFSPPLLKYTALTAFIMFTNMFAYFGLNLWLPELFNRFEAFYRVHPNETIAVCELAYLKEEHLLPMNYTGVAESYGNLTSNGTLEILSLVSELATSAINVTKTCDSFVDPMVFKRSMVIAFASLLGNFASVYLAAGRLNSRFVSFGSMMISGICGCAIYFLRTSMQNLIAICIFSSFAGTANVVISSVMVDIFPTSVNSMAGATASFAGRLGAILSNILFGLLLEISCEVPIFLVGGIVILGALAALLLPINAIRLPQQSEKADDNLSELKEIKNVNSMS